MNSEKVKEATAGRAWTREEDDFLRENFCKPGETNRTIAEKLGRPSEKSIYLRAKKLGITRARTTPRGSPYYADPSGSIERTYTDDEREFICAMDQYKRNNHRPFPTWSEALEVLQSLGYRKVAEKTALPGLKESS